MFGFSFGLIMIISLSNTIIIGFQMMRNNIYCCLDNDYKGKQSTDQIKKQMIKNTYDLRSIIQNLIKYNNGHLIKDWNECLKFSNYIDVDIKQFLGIQENKQL
ncbi:MAG: hypothetical protein E7413_02985 [Ruminococcaceae bacterium]|nr:hypothetical protein [Oscillospiraceae bacterium]